MRYKVVPRPRSLGTLSAVQRAVPLVPDEIEDCCARVVADTDIASRDDARVWITFAEALGLVERTDHGYRRLRRSVDAETLAPAFRERVFGAREVCDALATADGPLTATETFERVRGVVPRWERERYPDWESEWTDRVRRLLDWAVRLDLTERVDGGYRPAEG